MKKNMLNTAQQQAVEYTDGPLLIVAGAGTGKTTVISEKIKYLIDKKLAAPEEILALTFTDKAAAEMQERVDSMLDIGYVDLQISTFHAFCQRILETYALDIGLPNQFKLLTQTDAWLLLRQHIYTFDLEYYRPLGNPNRHIHEFLKHFSKCKDELITPAQYLQYAENLTLDKDQADIQQKNKITEIANAYHKYNQLLLDNQSLDFGDLIFYTVTLLEQRENIKKLLQKKYKYILVDEFQDVNWAQYQLVQLLAASGKLTVVGDDDQSIYAFRGASVSNILRFKEDYANSKEIVLNQNYRSGQEILDLAYTSIQENNPDRLEKKLNINKKLVASGSIKNAEVTHIHKATLEEEVQFVVEKIGELHLQHDANWDEIAILVRANNHATPFMQALESSGIPYEFIASSGLFRQPIVIDCINFLTVVDDVYQSQSIFRLLKLPCFEISDQDLQKLMYLSKKKSVSYYEGLKKAQVFRLSHSGVSLAQKLVTLIHEGINRARYDKPTTVLYHFLEESGYLQYLAHEEQSGNREIIRQLAQLKQFFEFVSSYEEAIPDANVTNFIEHYKHMVEAGDEGKLYQPSDTPDSVNILTIHGSKGLEYKYVFVVNMVQDRFPSRKRSDAIEIPFELIREQLPEGDYHVQEERRLFYVAATRAKEQLYFTSADNYGGVRKKKLSRFLTEIDFVQPDVALKSKEDDEDSTIIKQYNSAAIKQDEDLSLEALYPLPKAFSFSQIRSYKTCPYQYKLAHILKIPMRGSASFSFGNTMHNTLQKFYQKIQDLNGAKQISLFGTPVESSVQSQNGVKIPPFDELKQIFNNCWIDDWYTSKKQREDYHKKGREILKVFYATQEGNWTVPVALESWFKIKVGDYLVHGKMDRVDTLADGTLEIFDYKTGRSKEKLSAEDKEQLLLYQIAAEALPAYRNIGETSKLTFYYLNDDLQMSFVGGDKEKEKFTDKIKKILDKIHERDFTATPSKFICARCDFREICEYRV
jgi:DNA helicase II / ATP-dependent DNA helicase PcrA